MSDAELTGLIALSQDAFELRWCLEQAGVDLNVDPDEIGRVNSATARQDARRLDQVRLAWLLKNTPDALDWSSFYERIMQSLTFELETSAVIVVWGSEQVFALLRNAFVAVAASRDEFTDALEQVRSLPELSLKLGVSDTDCDESEARLKSARESSERQHNVIQIGGKEFDASEGNLKNLWALLAVELPDAALSSATTLINLDETAPLEKPRAKAPVERDKQTPPAKRPRRQPKSVDEAIGLAGEIVVFRLLRQRYGEDAVSASAWISGNSRYVYETNVADDGFGCDFKFSAKGRQYRVEVKATQGDTEVFSLGSSEIGLAMALAGKSKRRKETFLIVHVRNVLSSAPKVVVLPNPYDPASEGMYRIEDAEARVKYRTTRTISPCG